MHPFPECLDLFDDAGTEAPVQVQLMGSPPMAHEIGSLPSFGGRLQWFTGEQGVHGRLDAAFVIVIWDDSLHGPLAAQLAPPSFRSIVVILHRRNQTPPATINGRPMVHMSFGGIPWDAVLALVAPLLMPLVCRSVVCVDFADFEFLFAHGGRLRCLAETRGEDLEVCLTGLAWQLSKLDRPVVAYRRLLASMLLPSGLPAVSVVDRVVRMVHDRNTCEEPYVVVSTLVHDGATCWLSVFVVDPADEL